MKEKFAADRSIQLTGLLDSRYVWLGKGRVKRLVSGKNIRVNGKRVTADCAVTAGDEVEIFIPESFCRYAVDVVYADENVVIADKPAHTDSVTALPGLLSREYGVLYPVHRLDTNTTGLVVLARGSKTKAELERAFKERLVKKTYVATVVGRPPKKRGTLRGWLVKDNENGIVRVYDAEVKGGAEAVTDYEVLSSADGLSEIALYPLTGRTHQLRAQLAHMGCPILGDGKYGDFEENRKRAAGIQRLRAVEIEFVSLGGIINYLSGKKFKVKEQ